MLVDTHTHAVSPDVAMYPQRDATLPNGAWWDDGDHSAEALTAQVAGSPVDRVVLVQAAGVYGTDNRYLVEAAATSPVLSGVAVVDPMEADAVDQVHALAAAGICGIRLFHIPRPEQPWLASEHCLRLVDAAASNGLTITVCCMVLMGDDAELAELLAHRPDTPMVVDHCGFPDLSGGPPFEAAAPLWSLAEHPNLHLKLTPTLVEMFGADPAELVTALVDQFGAERIVWGSDWPQHRGADTYADQVAEVQSWLGHLPEPHRGAIAGDNALRLWPTAWSER